MNFFLILFLLFVAVTESISVNSGLRFPNALLSLKGGGAWSLFDQNTTTSSVQNTASSHNQNQFGVSNKDPTSSPVKDADSGENKKRTLAPKVVEIVLRKLLSYAIADPDIQRIVAKLLSICFWLLLFLSLAGSAGVDTKPFLGVLSIALVTIGIGAKDILINTFAGLFLLFARPFRRGNYVRLHGRYQEFAGKVQSIDLRYLKLENVKEKSIIMLPLSFVIGSPITIEKREEITHKTE